MFESAGRQKSWSRLFPAFSAATAAVFLASCAGADSGGDDTPSEESSPSRQGAQEEDGPLATSTITAMDEKGGLEVTVNSLDRVGAGRVVVKMSVTNESDTRHYTNHMFATAGKERAMSNTGRGVTLIDTSNGRRHFAFMRSDEDTCLCSNWGGGALDKGESQDFWVAFPEPPGDVTRMTVTTPVTPDFVDLPLGESEPRGKKFLDIPVEDPEILDLTAYQESLDGDSSRADTGNEASISLSSDVLFELNESDLTPAAGRELKKVAKEIDDSSAEVVRIDGHTDNSGNDSINSPLSKARAESVEKELESLITRNGVTFETDGHGSSDPIADNSTEEGRKKNRRVTVTFEK